MASKKILVIDDDKDFTKLLGFQLEAKGYHVVVSNEGEEGFQKVLDEKPDLILLDIKMPDLDGFTFVRRLKANGLIQKIPVMILTGYETMRALFQFEGIAGYFVKGDNMAALIKSIADIFQASEGA
ncbi:MAG: response regulator [Candidatus Omnitrophota bacterium]